MKLQTQQRQPGFMKRLAYAGLLVLLCTTIFTSMLPARQRVAYADDYGYGSPADEIQTKTSDYSYYAAFEGCFTSPGNGKDKTTPIEVKAGDPIGGIYTSFDNGATDTTVGYTTTTDTSDGKMRCYNTVQHMRDLLGFSDDASFLQFLGFRSLNGVWVFTNGKDFPQASFVPSEVQKIKYQYMVPPTKGAIGMIADRVKTKADAQGITTLNDAMRYQLSIDALTKGACKVTFESTQPTDFIRPVSYVTTDTGEIAQRYATLVADTIANTGTKVKQVTQSKSYALATYPQTTSRGTTNTCYDVAGTMSDTANAYSSAIKSGLASRAIAAKANAASVILVPAVCGADDGTDTYKNCSSTVYKCLGKTSIWNARTNQTIQIEGPAALIQDYPDQLAQCIHDGDNSLKVQTVLDAVTNNTAALLKAIGSTSYAPPDPCTANPQGLDAAGNKCPASGSDICSKNVQATDPMPWLACSLLTAVNGIVGGISSLYTSILYVDVNAWFANGDAISKVFSVFRNIAMILVIIVGLVMVIAQATGTDIVDAYTVKKVLPKLGVAIVMLAIAWPVLRFLTSLSNDLGFFTQRIFSDMGIGSANVISYDKVQGMLNGIGLTSVAVAGYAVSLGVYGLILFLISLLISFVMGLLTLVLQRILMAILVVLAPLAIVAYILPNTEKLWKRWLSEYAKTFLLFTVIMLIIQLGGVVAKIAGGIGDGLVSGFIVIGTIALTIIAPKRTSELLGGLQGAVGGLMSKSSEKMTGRVDKAREHAVATHREHAFGRPILSARAETQRQLKDLASKSNNRFASSLLRGAGRAVGGYNLEAQMSQRQAGVAKEVNDQIATGRDDEIRGLTVDKEAALRGTQGVDWRMQGKKRQFRTLGGAWMDEASVDEGHKRWGKDRYAQQAALSYEMRKSNSEEDVNRISSRYGGLAKSWGMTNNEASGAWIGAAFENQNQHLEFKKTDWETGELGSSGYQELVDETYEKKGAYPLAQMHSRTIERLKQAHADADNTISTGTIRDKKGNVTTASTRDIQMAKDRKEKIAGIAETFMQELSSGGVAGMAGDVPIPQTGGAAMRQVGASGAGHVNERVRELAEMSGVLGTAPAGNYSQPSVHTAVSPVNRRAGTTVDPNQRSQKR